MTILKHNQIWFAGALLFLISACSILPTIPRNNGGIEDVSNSLLRVTVTGQSYVFHRPWQQRRPVTQTAIGVIVSNKRVLVTGLLVANHRYIELETLDTRKKQPARVVVVDYDANLALLEPLDPDFLEGRTPLSLSEDAAMGDTLTVWQVKPNGDAVPDQGKITSVELSRFSLNNYFMIYRLNSSLQYRFSNLTLPVVQGDLLAGMVLRQKKAGQTIDVISAPVIHHFLNDAEQGVYQGFPSAGFHFGKLLDPQLRRYIRLPDDIFGIYVQKVIKGGPAHNAGLKSGDVITRIGDFSISNTGQFEHPAHGQTPLSHLISTRYYAGDTVVFAVFRDNQAIDMKVVLDHRRPSEYLVPPYVVDQKPEYLILGGLVIQELSLTYLREYGREWVKDAPIHLLYYQQNQDYLNNDLREKIVIISDVIPTAYTIGYEKLSNLVILKVNGQSIGKLSDVRKALAAPMDGFHKIEVQQHPRVLYLDPEELFSIHQMIEQRYRIPIPPLIP